MAARIENGTPGTARRVDQPHLQPLNSMGPDIPHPGIGLGGSIFEAKNKKKTVKRLPLADLPAKLHELKGYPPAIVSEIAGAIVKTIYPEWGAVDGKNADFDPTKHVENPPTE